MRLLILLTISALAGLGIFLALQRGTFTPRVLSAQPVSGDANMAIATFAPGCFWGVQATFDNVPGVTRTTVGYTGGHTVNPTYEDVCSHTTGHAEAVRVEYDPGKVPYDELLRVFWASHDPTTPNRQGPDVGSQYRSAVFYHTPEQRDAAVKMREALEKSGKFDRPIVTEITPAGPFYVAEDYHQRYLAKRGLASCHVGP